MNEGETLSDSWKSSNKKVNNDNESKHCGRQMKRNVKRCQGYPSQVFSGQGHWNQKKWWHDEETKSQVGQTKKNKNSQTVKQSRDRNSRYKNSIMNRLKIEMGEEKACNHIKHQLESFCLLEKKVRQPMKS